MRPDSRLLCFVLLYLLGLPLEARAKIAEVPAQVLAAYRSVICQDPGANIVHRGLDWSNTPLSVRGALSRTYLDLLAQHRQFGHEDLSARDFQRLFEYGLSYAKQEPATFPHVFLSHRNPHVRDWDRAIRATVEETLRLDPKAKSQLRDEVHASLKSMGIEDFDAQLSRSLEAQKKTENQAIAALEAIHDVPGRELQKLYNSPRPADPVEAYSLAWSAFRPKTTDTANDLLAFNAHLNDWTSFAEKNTEVLDKMQNRPIDGGALSVTFDRANFGAGGTAYIFESAMNKQVTDRAITKRALERKMYSLLVPRSPKPETRENLYREFSSKALAECTDDVRWALEKIPPAHLWITSKIPQLHTPKDRKDLSTEMIWRTLLAPLFHSFEKAKNGVFQAPYQLAWEKITDEDAIQMLSVAEGLLDKTPTAITDTDIQRLEHGIRNMSEGLSSKVRKKYTKLLLKLKSQKSSLNPTRPLASPLPVES